jgi:hypothetical protein
MSKQEAKQIIETANLINVDEDKQRYLESSLIGLRSVDFFEYFSRDHMRIISRIFKLHNRARLDKWELCEEMDKLINDL